MKQLSDIISVQNQTISILEGALSAKSEIPNIAQLLLSVSQKEERLSALTTELQLLQDKLDSQSNGVHSAQGMNLLIDKSDSAVSTSFLVPEQEGLQKECSAKYGEETMITIKNEMNSSFISICMNYCEILTSDYGLLSKN